MKLVCDDVQLQDTRTRKVRIPADDRGPSRLVLPGSPSEPPKAETQVVTVSESGVFDKPPLLVGTNGEPLSSLSWPEFLAWRKTKCRPYHCDPNRIAVSVSTPGKVLDNDHARALEEIDQAILEFIGEVAELSELFNDHGAATFYGLYRQELIDECGDCFFCGAWAMDSWGANPLYQATDLELIRVTDEDPLAILAQIVQSSNGNPVPIHPQHASIVKINVCGLLGSAMTHAGLLANSYKKLRYQRREQNVELQIGRIMQAMAAVNQILVVANSNVEEALRVNMFKLNSRYPEGYKPGQGGGIREGAGK